MAGRVPVLAIGSNSSPSQLDRKFTAPIFKDSRSPEGTILVYRARVPNIDIVYAAHIASYGSLPATIMANTECTANVFITWLTPRQFQQMNRTEGVGTRYSICRIVSVRCEGVKLDAAYGYASKYGVAGFGSAPLGLNAFDVEGSRLERVNQLAVWDELARETTLGENGVQLLQNVLEDEGLRAAVEGQLSKSAMDDGCNPVELFDVDRTTAAHHQRRSQPYVLAIHPNTARRLKLSKRAGVSALSGTREANVLAYLVRDAKQPPGRVGLDQTIRSAIGLPRAGEALGNVRLTPIRLTMGQWIKDKLSWIGGRRYLLLRVYPPDPPDIEKSLCRLADGDITSLGTEPGGRVLLLAGDLEEATINRESVQALSLTESMAAIRQGHMRATWAARYPDAAKLLAIEGENDLRAVWVDKDMRDRLHLRIGDVVLVRRSLPNAFLSQLLDFGVTLLALTLALDRILPHSPWLSVSIGVATTTAVMIARLRSRLG